MIGNKMKRDFDRKLKNKKSKKIKYEFYEQLGEEQSKKNSSKRKKFRNVDRYEIEEWM